MFLRCLLPLLLLASCHKVPDTVTPNVTYSVPDRYLTSLPSPFPALSPIEKMEDFSKEYTIGLAFAKNLDLYQAITAFRRAEILVDPTSSRLLEIQYEILLCYYIGQKYQEVTQTFEKSRLKNVDSTFPAFSDLLIILEDSYRRIGNTTQADNLEKALENHDPSLGQRLEISRALLEGDLSALHALSSTAPYMSSFLDDYQERKKSVGAAQGLNALLPGAGYLYLGQTQSAVTAFLLNSLFITAAAYSFDQGNLAAGIIFTSFEVGWYFGGVYGAGLEAKYYNERLYEKMVSPLMQKERLFPVLMLRFGF